MLKRDWKVLLVDDDPDDHLLIRDIAREIGCHLDWADRYDAGLERIAGQTYDVCLIDYRLGDRDGLDLIREGLVRGYQGPMILLTGPQMRSVFLAIVIALPLASVLFGAAVWWRRR